MGFSIIINKYGFPIRELAFLYQGDPSTHILIFLAKVKEGDGKECWSIVRDESSVYFNVTAKHVWHLVATVYKPTVPCMITIELSDIWLISEAIYHLIFTQDPLNWSLESPPQHRDDFVMPTFLYRVKKTAKNANISENMYMCHIMWQNWNYIEHSLSGCDCW